MFIKLDADTILSELKEGYEKIVGREILPAQSEHLMLQLVAYREVLMRNEFNAAMSQLLFKFSTAPIIDYLAEMVGVERLPAAKAGCTVKFTLVPQHGGVTIPEGLRVSTADGKAIFRIVEEVVVAPTTLAAAVDAEATVEGSAANGYPVGAVANILDPKPYLSAVSNTTTTSGGSDVETDDQLRERMKLAPSRFSSAGAKGSYLYYARSASPDIVDVSVGSRIAGTVNIYVIANTMNADGSLPSEIIKNVLAACNDEVRPMTDTVEVSAPEYVGYSLGVTLTLHSDADEMAVIEKVAAQLRSYAEEKSRKIGQDIVSAQIFSLCLVEGVYNVELKLKDGAGAEQPAIRVGGNQVSKNTGIKVTKNQNTVDE
jgi:phage-related baseplate assembly protein